MEEIQQSEVLEMLYRRDCKDGSFKMDVCTHDLQMLLIICEYGMYPCSHQLIIRPSSAFSSFESLCEYFLVDAEEDVDNIYINDFLTYLELPNVDEDEIISLYEGHSSGEIKAMKREKRAMEAQSERDFIEEQSERNRSLGLIF
jgi:hypothetical protein